MSLPLGLTPRKRAKLDTFTSSFEELVAQLSTINGSLSSEAPSSQASRLAELSSLSLKREAFEDSLRRVKKQLEGVEQARDWREELDRAGVELWNRSTVFKDNLEAATAATEHVKSKVVVAQIRLNAFKIISLGAPETMGEKDHVALLNLSTRAFNALYDSDGLSAAEEILSAGAEHCASISPLCGSEGATLVSTVRTVLAHYTTRIIFSVKNGKIGVAEWIKSTVKDELLSHLKEREICKLASTSYEAGRWLLAPKRGIEAEIKAVDKGDSEQALPWLLWSLELLVGVGGVETQSMQINVLAALVEAYLDTSAGPSRLEKAENSILQLLRLQPTGALSRRRIKILIAREAGDSEIARAFVEASTACPWTEDQGARLLHQLHKLPNNRRSLKSGICDALLEVAIQLHLREALNREPMRKVSTSTSNSSPTSSFLTQVVMAAVLIIKGGSLISGLFQKISKAAPSFRLDSQSTFLCITYIWRAADKAHTQGNIEEAAALYLLCTEPMLMALQQTWPKSFRKAALCYGELKKYDEAEKVICHDPSAKGLFVRIYNLIGNSKYHEAAALIEPLINAEGFSLKLLLWTAKAAQEAGSDALLCNVFEIIISYSTRNVATNGDVDCMVVFRQLIRALMNRASVAGANNAELLPLLRGHFAGALKLATSLAEKSPVPEMLPQSVAWLYRTGYNLCIRFADNRALGSSTFFGIIANLIELETSLSPITRSETWTQYLQCRFVAMTEHLISARSASTGTTGRVDAYKLLLSHLNKLENDIGDLATSKLCNAQIERTLETLGALKLEAWSALGEWERALEVAAHADSNQRTEKSIKLLAQKAVSDDGCPPAILQDILKATLKNLFARGELDAIRLMAGLLIEEKPDEAFQYFSNAASFIASLSTYPVDEQSWLTITAWDKGESPNFSRYLDMRTISELEYTTPTGIDAFGGQHPSAGHQWCSLALRLAHSSQAQVLAKMEADYEALCEKFPESGEGEMEMTEAER